MMWEEIPIDIDLNEDDDSLTCVDNVYSFSSFENEVNNFIDQILDGHSFDIGRKPLNVTWEHISNWVFYRKNSHIGY